MKVFLSALSIIFIGLLLFNLWLYTQQPGMLFYPTAPLEATPAEWGLAYEEVAITTADQIKLHGWYLPAAQATQVLLFFHGNAGNISHRRDSLQIFHDLGLNILIIDYRGYGRSEGRISEAGLYQDAQAAWDYLHTSRGFPVRDIIVFGRSLGGAVATHLASQVQPRALILESTFSSVRDMADFMMPLVSRLIFLRYEFDTVAVIRQLKSPLLMLHSPDDEIIPYVLGQRVFVAAQGRKYSYDLRGGHNEGFVASQPGYAQAIAAFLAQLP